MALTEYKHVGGEDVGVLNRRCLIHTARQKKTCLAPWKKLMGMPSTAIEKSFGNLQPTRNHGRRNSIWWVDLITLSSEERGEKHLNLFKHDIAVLRHPK